MSGEKWTPGPWRILGEDDSIGGVPFIEVMGGEIATPTYRDVTHVCADLGDDDEFRLTDEDWANAHLIAAAPELYEALKQAVDIIREHVPTDALGTDTDCPGAGPGEPYREWPVLEEYLHHMNAALARARGDRS